MKRMAISLAVIATFAIVPGLHAETTAMSQDRALSPGSAFSPSTIAAINAHMIRAASIARQIRQASGSMDEANYLSLQQALLAASPAGLDAAASAISYKAAMAAVRSAPSATQNAKGSGLTTKDLGSLTNEFVFSPIVPCRLLDTRTPPGTRLTPFVAKGVDFDGGNPGNAAGCTFSGVSAQIGGTAGLNNAALAINLTATAATGAGWIQARPVGSTNVSSNQNFYANQDTANLVIVQDAGTTNEFELYSNQNPHAVVDVLGVFTPASATALACNFATKTNLSIPANSNTSVFAGACAAGYTSVSIMCDVSSFSGRVVSFDLDNGALGPYCAFRNDGATAITGSAQLRCCRTPGR
jgi:hypothetical protein